MTPTEIEEIFIPTEWHPGWNPFCYTMQSYQYGREALVQAWAFYRKGWDAMLSVHNRVSLALYEEVLVAEAVRDDARASGQRYLEEKRQFEADAKQWQEFEKSIPDKGPW